MKSNLSYGHVFGAASVAMLVAGTLVLSKILSPDTLGLLLVFLSIFLFIVGFAILVTEKSLPYLGPEVSNEPANTKRK